MAEEVTERIRRALSAYRHGGVEAMLPFVHPDFAMTTTPEVATEPDTYEGHDGLRRYFGSFFDAMDEVRIEPVEMESRGDRVRMDFDLVARGRATGIEATQRGHAIWRLEDDLLREVTFFTTEAESREALDAG